MEEKNRKLEMEFENFKNSINDIFTEGQIKKMCGKTAVKWNLDDISSATCLYSVGARSYKYMYKKNFPLPGISTLKRWASKIVIKPGVLNSVLKLMQKSELNEHQRICILSFDEMKIKACYEYDRLNDSVLNPSNYVQVVMARGLTQKWKQPVYYNYDTNMTTAILNNIICELHHVGYMVVGIVSDMGPSNQKLWKSLSIGLMKTWFPHPEDCEKKIFVFADPPHLLKLVRNHFIDSGFIYNNTLINVNPIREMIDITSISDLKISHKITDLHITVQKNARQNVQLAAQLLSHTVSSCIRRCVQLGRSTCSNALECADFIKSINDWFDIFNSQIPEADSRPRIKAFGLAIEEQAAILNEVDQLIIQLRTPGKRVLLPFQKGILISNQSLRGLYNYLKNTYKFTYILTNRLNQDVLENFFACIRSKGGLNDHPTALDFKYRLRSYLLGRNRTILSSSSTAKDDDIPLQLNWIDTDLNEIVITNTFCRTIPADIGENDKEEEYEFEEMQLDALENFAGYIIKKCKADLDLDVVICRNRTSHSWVDEISEGGLIKPSELFLNQVKNLEQIFQTVNKNKIRTYRGSVQHLMKLSENIELIKKVKELFFRSRIYFRIKNLNKKLISCNKRKNNKFKKICT